MGVNYAAQRTRLMLTAVNKACFLLAALKQAGFPTHQTAAK